MSRAPIAFWPHTGSASVASTRIRCLQVVAGLRGFGLDARLLADKQGPDATAPPAVLVLGKRYDKESIERAVALRRAAGTALVLDLCDNHFFSKHARAQWQVRAEQLRAAVLSVDCVVTASPVLADVVREACPLVTNVQVVPDALDEWSMPTGLSWSELWGRLRLAGFEQAHPVGIGRRLMWFGNHGADYADGGMQDLAAIADALHRHHAQQPVRLSIVSNSRDAWRRLCAGWELPTLYLPWSMALFRLALQRHDVALIPAQLNPFTRCKTNNRLATSFAGGLAVAASRLPAYEEFGDLAVLDDWEAGLGALMASHEDRARRVQGAAQRLRERYAIDAVCRRWREVIQGLVDADAAARTSYWQYAPQGGEKESHDPLAHRI